MNKEVNSQVRDTQYCSVTFIFILTSSLASWQLSLAYGKPRQKPRHQIWGRLSNRGGVLYIVTSRCSLYKACKYISSRAMVA